MKKRLGEETWYFPGRVNSGLFRDCIIDTAWDEDTYGGWAPAYVLITHGHADHFQQAYYLRKKGAKVLAPQEEAFMVENPDLNIRAMFSWAWPPQEMVTSFFKGNPCKVDAYIEQGVPSGINWISLPGHSVAQVGYLTEDGVLFSGDALYTKELWDAFPLPYCIDLDLARNSLVRLQNTDFKWLVPGHGVPLSKEESNKEINSHLKHLALLDAMILGFLKTPKSTEEIVSDIYIALNLRVNLAQYWLAVTVIKAHLSSLYKQEKVSFLFNDCRVYWEAV